MPYNSPRGMIAASVILELLAVFCVACRFLSRRKKGVNLATDDWLIFAALIGGTGLTVMEIYGKFNTRSSPDVVQKRKPSYPSEAR